MAVNKLQQEETFGSNTVHAEQNMPSLNDNELTTTEFKNWIEQAENKPTISLQEAQNKWTKTRKYLQQSIK